MVEIAQTVGKALLTHYGVRPEWGGLNYAAHEAIEKEESGETKKTISSTWPPMPRGGTRRRRCEMHRLLEDYAAGLARRYPD